MAFKFENLKVWQRAINYTAEVHVLTRGFPKEELYILAAQMKRAADSIALNIAEGSTGSSKKQFDSFLGHALRSGIETVSCLYVGRARDLITQENFDKHYEELTIIIKMIQALRNSLNL